jgi:hypothetical protein
LLYCLNDNNSYDELLSLLLFEVHLSSLCHSFIKGFFSYFSYFVSLVYLLNMCSILGVTPPVERGTSGLYRLNHPLKHNYFTKCIDSFLSRYSLDFLDQRYIFIGFISVIFFKFMDNFWLIFYSQILYRNLL